MNQKRVLITGAGGFVGKHLTEVLLSQGGSEIYANVYNQSSDLSDLLPSSQIIPADLTDFAATSQIIKDINPDIIYHLASLSIVHNSTAEAQKILTNNISLQYNLLESVRLYSPKARIVFVSSGNVYGNANHSHIPLTENTPLRPLNPYAVSKINQEYLSLQYFLAHQVDLVILRPFNHTGAGQTTNFVVPMLAQQFVAIKKGAQSASIQVGNINTQRDFTDVRDICQAYLLAAQKAVSGEIYNIGSGVGVSVGEIIKIMEDLMGLKVKIEIEASRVRTSDVPVLVCDSSKFRNLTGWSPKITLRDTLKNVLDYWEQKYDEHNQQSSN